MGFVDKIKGFLGGHKDEAKQEVDKAATVVDEKTGGAHSEQITSEADQAKDTIEKLGDGA